VDEDEDEDEDEEVGTQKNMNKLLNVGHVFPQLHQMVMIN
jgi:hypothetical protein